MLFSGFGSPSALIAAGVIAMSARLLLDANDSVKLASHRNRRARDCGYIDKGFVV